MANRIRPMVNPIGFTANRTNLMVNRTVSRTNQAVNRPHPTFVPISLSDRPKLFSGLPVPKMIQKIRKNQREVRLRNRESDNELSTQEATVFDRFFKQIGRFLKTESFFRPGID